MCSRFAVTSPPEAIRRYFEYRNLPNFPPRYNIAPTQPIAAVRIDAQGSRELVLLRWGLIPSWVKDPRDFTTLINARSETVLTKPSFRSAIRHRRCLIPADGFYEWKGARGNKKAFLINAFTQKRFCIVIVDFRLRHRLGFWPHLFRPWCVCYLRVWPKEQNGDRRPERGNDFDGGPEQEIGDNPHLLRRFFVDRPKGAID